MQGSRIGLMVGQPRLARQRWMAGDLRLDEATEAIHEALRVELLGVAADALWIELLVAEIPYRLHQRFNRLLVTKTPVSPSMMVESAPPAP